MRGISIHASALVATWLWAQAGCIAQEVPTPLDTRASYCLVILSEQVQAGNDALHGKTTPRYVHGIIEAGLVRLRDAQRHFEMHLASRRPLLERGPLETAAADARSDLEAGGPVLDACAKSCEAHPASDRLHCEYECWNRSDAVARVRSCFTPALLPPGGHAPAP